MLGLFVNTVFPLGLILALVLSLPLPRSLFRFITGASAKVLFYRIPFLLGYGISVGGIILGISFLLFITTTYRMWRRQEEYSRRRYLGEASKDLLLLRFREERNFYIAAFSLVLWLLIYRLQAMRQKVYALTESLAAVTSVSFVDAPEQPSGLPAHPAGSRTQSAAAVAEIRADQRVAEKVRSLPTDVGLASAPPTSPVSPTSASGIRHRAKRTGQSPGIHPTHEEI